MAFFNPFCSQEAISYSNYCTLQQKEFTPSKPVKGRMKQATEQVASKLSAFVADLKKPAQQLGLNVRKKSCNFGVYPQLGSTAATAGLCRDLVNFLHDHKSGKAANPTFMAVFATPAKLSEEVFNAKVRDQIALLQKAAEPFFCIPETLKEHLLDDEQTIMFGGKAMKVVSIYRNTSNGQLKFDYPMLAFSLQKEINSATEQLSADEKPGSAS